MVRRRPPRSPNRGGASGPVRGAARPPRALTGLLLFLFGVLAGAGGFYLGCRNPQPTQEPPGSGTPTPATEREKPSHRVAPHRTTPTRPGERQAPAEPGATGT